MSSSDTDEELNVSQDDVEDDLIALCVRIASSHD